MFEKRIQEHIDCFKRIAGLKPMVCDMGDRLARTLKNGNKILICGNGGSASDSQHFAAEIVGRFYKDRKALPAIALTTDTSIITAVANDYGYEDVFSRQTEALGTPGDMLVGLSTSGNSENIIQAFQSAKNQQMTAIALTGGDGGRLAGLADFCINVPCEQTPRIQEAHAFILHFWAEQIESTPFGEKGVS
jgi:D-sedoheptulose 7-phosphate isomerase